MKYPTVELLPHIRYRFGAYFAFIKWDDISWNRSIPRHTKLSTETRDTILHNHHHTLRPTMTTMTATTTVKMAGFEFHATIFIGKLLIGYPTNYYVRTILRSNYNSIERHTLYLWLSDARHSFTLHMAGALEIRYSLQSGVTSIAMSCQSANRSVITSSTVINIISFAY